MPSLNHVMIIGHLGRDPEIRQMSNGKPVANFSVAASESWKDKVTGEKKERTEWFNVVAYDRLAEYIGQYTKKGALVYVEGSLQTRKWQDKTTGQDRHTVELIAKEFKNLDRKPADGGESAPTASAQAATTRPAQASTHRSEPPSSGVPAPDLNDDIPF